MLKQLSISIILITCAICALANPAQAQDVPDIPEGASGNPAAGTEKMDVRTGDLSPELEAKRPDPSSAPRASSASSEGGQQIGKFEVKPRNQEEVEKIYEQMISGYRSACCPHQEMADPGCPCHTYQALMLRFLITKGFTPGTVDTLMVQGVNQATLGADAATIRTLTAAYARWLPQQEEYRNWRAEDSQLQAAERLRAEQLSEADIDSIFFGRFTEVNTKLHGTEDITYGWNQGWTELIREAPTANWLYIVLASAAMVLVGLFAFGMFIMLRKPGEDAAGDVQAESNSDDAAPASEGASDARKQIEAELADMDEED